MYLAEVPFWLVIVLVIVLWIGIKKLNQISPNKARELVSGGSAIIVDVRSPQEFSGGAVQGAINIPLSDLKQIESAVESKEAAILCYCLSGTRSGAAVSQLKRMGYTAHNLGSYHRAVKVLAE